MSRSSHTATVTHPSTPGGVHMNKELFGVFGGRDAFDALRNPDRFATVLTGKTVTVGVRDPYIGHPGRTDVHEDGDGFCVIWGEAHASGSPAAELYEGYVAEGLEGLTAANGSYVAVLEYDGHAVVVTDPIRSWECFYTETHEGRVFGTDLASVAEVADDLSIDDRAPFEFLHLGTVLGEKTLFESVRRVPFDGYLTTDDVSELRRFVYEPREFDYANELTGRLRRAIQRRCDLPDRKGILLSAGQDSRSILAGVSDITHSYTIGSVDGQESTVARRLAAQYGLDHEVLAPDERYLLPDDPKVLYSQGLRESLHIHHAGYDDVIEADSIYHGLLYDTVLKGYFLERNGAELFGAKVPFQSVDDDVDPIASLLDTLGFLPEGSARLVQCAGDLLRKHGVDVGGAPADPGAFLDDALRSEFAASQSRADSVHNAMDLAVLRNQPAMSFRTHLADNYVETLVVADAELLEWHRQTPPSHRHPKTVHRAIAALDDDIFRHRPPGRPRESNILSQAERFARRKLPLVRAVEPSWPDRRTVYERHGIGRKLFPDHPGVRELPSRLQLRLHDLRWWLSVRE